MSNGMPELKWQSDDCYNLEELMLGRVRVGFVKIEYSDSDGEPSRYFWENEIEDQPVWRDVEKNQSPESLVEAQSLLEASVRHSLGLDTVKPLVEALEKILGMSDMESSIGDIAYAALNAVKAGTPNG